MKRLALYGVLFGVLGFVACGDDGSSADGSGVDPENEVSTIDITENSSADAATSSTNVAGSSDDVLGTSEDVALNSSADAAMSSTEVAASSDNAGLSSAQNQEPASSASVLESSSDVVPESHEEKFNSLVSTFTLKPFEGPLANPHKGFTVPTEGTWIFDPAVEYGPYGEWKNGAWDLVTYGSGYQKWSDLHKGDGVYDWSELDALLEALASHGMGYALRVFPYTPSFIKGNDTPT